MQSRLCSTAVPCMLVPIAKEISNFWVCLVWKLWGFLKFPLNGKALHTMFSFKPGSMPPVDLAHSYWSLLIRNNSSFFLPSTRKPCPVPVLALVSESQFKKLRTIFLRSDVILENSYTIRSDATFLTYVLNRKWWEFKSALSIALFLSLLNQTHIDPNGT